MKKAVNYFLLGCGVLLLFVLFSYLVHKDLFVQFDFDSTVKLQDKIPRRVDQPFSFLSDFGQFEVMLIGVLLVIAIFARWIWGIAIFGFFGLLHVVELFGKFFVTHPPPPEFMIRTERIVDFPRFHVRADFSYPSGHAARAAFVSVILGFLVWRSKRLSKLQKYILFAALTLYDLIMFVSRIYLGEHWATDVIGGVLLGGSMALLACAFALLSIKKIIALAFPSEKQKK